MRLPVTEVPYAPNRAMLRRLAAVVVLALSLVSARSPGLAPDPTPAPVPSPTATPMATSLSIPTTSAMVASATTLAPVALTTSPIPTSPSPIPRPPTRSLIAPDPPPPTVAQAKAWARETLGPAEYGALDRIVWNESRWDPAAVNPRGGACGLGQSWPCSKLSSAVPDWPTQPIEQLRFFISYGKARYGSLRNAWAYWCAHGRW